MTAHFNEADHKCHICGEGYMIQSELQKHVSMNHLNERPYQCDQCPNSYKSQSGLEQHIGKKLKMFISKIILTPFRAQTFTFLMADLRHDINRVSSFSKCINGTFP